MDSFTLPVIPDSSHAITRTEDKAEKVEEHDEDDDDDQDDDHCISFNKDVIDHIQFNKCRAEQRINNTHKSKSFSLFGLSKWKKTSSGLENKEKLENDDINNNKRRKVI